MKFGPCMGLALIAFDPLPLVITPSVFDILASLKTQNCPFGHGKKCSKPSGHPPPPPTDITHICTDHISKRGFPMDRGYRGSNFMKKII